MSAVPSSATARRGAAGAVLLVGLALLAGCVGPLADDPGGTTTPTAGTAADNPFGQSVVPVWINDTVEDGRNTTWIVATAIDYWHANMDRYSPYDYRFRLVEDREAARIEVRFVDDVTQCGEFDVPDAVGCASLLEPGDTAAELELVRVETFGPNDAVLGTLEHEFGHVLGLNHSVEPTLLMSHTTSVDLRNASARVIPWYDHQLSVYVDYDSLAGDPSVVRDQVGHAVAYFDAGAEGTIPTNMSFDTTRVEPSAEVVVTNDPADGCTVDGGSGYTASGEDPDDDGEGEILTRVTICLDEVDEDAVGWHVAGGLAFAMSLDQEELPPALRDAGYRERRSAWWE